mmetsp:Transcript_17063/g.36059  ORF Transcript_17063/g.36059 Transcript_17063/m.36059 type:complete len:200 (+) Transcript_17063:1027-1626(+)
MLAEAARAGTRSCCCRAWARALSLVLYLVVQRAQESPLPTLLGLWLLTVYLLSSNLQHSLPAEARSCVKGCTGCCLSRPISSHGWCGSSSALVAQARQRALRWCGGRAHCACGWCWNGALLQMALPTWTCVFSTSRLSCRRHRLRAGGPRDARTPERCTGLALGRSSAGCRWTWTSLPGLAQRRPRLLLAWSMGHITWR